ncbi:MAG: ABC transporter ATP-binding protein [Pseudomonadales bacterium]
MSAIELQALGFRYPGASEDTLTDLNLSIAAGEAHALLGGSGAGKTTLLNLLSGLLLPTAGDIRFGSDSVAQVPASARGVAQVFQFPVLYDALSVLDNLGFPLRTAGIPKAQRHARALHIAELLDFSGNDFGPLAKQRPASLSLYQKQLLAIGKALVRPDLKLVLLDEPLTAVAPSLKWALRKTLRQVQRELGVTMVYVTHDQTEALTFADRVSVMHEGAIVQCDTPQALYQRPQHTYVGYFIGSPGMNFVSATVQDGVLHWADSAVPLTAAVADGPVQVGFRPEWGALAEAGAPPAQDRVGLTLQGQLHSTRTTALEAGVRSGLMRINTPEPVELSGALRYAPGAELQIRLPYALLYRDQRHVGSVGTFAQVATSA